MSRICALAGIDRAKLPLFTAIFKAMGETRPAVTSPLDVRALGRLHPDVLIGDLDHLDVDAMELLRQIRFVLPGCMIAIYGDDTHKAWGRACHMAGANGVLSKRSTQTELTNGITNALATGCFTDPRVNA